MKKSISFLILLFLLGSYHIYYYFSNHNQTMKIEKIIENVNNVQENNPPLNVEKINKDESYFGIIEIPKIKLKQEFYNIDNINNDVNNNIYVLPSSQMPDIKPSTLIIAAHSGNSYLGYFKNLNQLSLNDEIRIYYHQKKYLYYVYDIDIMPKNGQISFNKNIGETVLVLTTCYGKEEQLVVLAKIGN